MKEETDIVTDKTNEFIFYVYDIASREGIGYCEACQMAREKFEEIFGVKDSGVLTFISHYTEAEKRSYELEEYLLKLIKQIENKEKIFLVQQPYWLF